LLCKISAIKELNDFFLARGTALSLQVGHRISYDLDFFLCGEFSNENILDSLEEIGKREIVSQTKRILVLLVDGIKVDFVRHLYQTLEMPQQFPEFKLASLKDISAMKLMALAGRGRKRDFVDLYFLLKVFKLKDMLAFYEKKYPDGNKLMVIRSLVYFKDAENDPDINYIHQNLDWEEIKTSISNSLSTI